MSITDGGPAHPYVVVTKVDGETGSPLRQEVQTGMSMRDFFAAQAMDAIGRTYYGISQDSGINDLLGKPNFAEEAKRCYQWADAMLAEREKSQQPLWQPIIGRTTALDLLGHIQAGHTQEPPDKHGWIRCSCGVDFNANPSTLAERERQR